MTAKEQSFNFLATEFKVTIPFFQRGYVWDKDNWEELLLTLLNNENKNQFLGSIIFKKLASNTGEISESLVIDGQQRLTTLSVLFRCLYNSFDSDIQENCKDAMHSHLFYKKRTTDKDFHIKINHSKIDREYYSKVIQNQIDTSELDKISKSSNKILQCYEYFTEKLADISKDERLDLFDRLASQSYNILVVIDLASEDNEQAIFDTINNAGIRLSSSDTIKNALFQQVINLFDETKAIELYGTYWDNIFLKDDDTIAFWDKKRRTGRIYRDSIEIVLHSVALIKGFFNPDNHTFSDLPNQYKQYMKELDKECLMNFIKEISEYAILFKNKIKVFDKDTIFNFNNYSDRLIHILSILESTTLYPYILHLSYKYKDNEDKLKEELYRLEVFVIRDFINNNGIAHNYNKLVPVLIREEAKHLNEITKILTDANIEKALSTNIKNKYATLLLFWVELYRRANDNKAQNDELHYVYSLEHIMPINHEKWEDIDIVDDNGNKIEDKELAKETREAKINHIGNMTLLTKRLNSSLSNNCFRIKMEGDANNRGIIHYNELYITKDITDKYNKDDDGKIWNEKKITERTKALSKEILTIWKS